MMIVVIGGEEVMMPSSGASWRYTTAHCAENKTQKQHIRHHSTDNLIDVLLARALTRELHVVVKDCDILSFSDCIATATKKTVKL